jgi:thiamine biosynthesis lipoprotein
VQEHLRRFRALGSECLVRVVVTDDDPSGPALLDGAVGLLDDIESRWSRFRPDSELSALNAHAGSPVFTSPDTATVVAMAVEAWRVTGGLFDPTVHDALVASGYDRTFDELAATGVGPGAAGPAPVPGPADIEVDERLGLVVLPPGCHIDLGGIGKGRSADLVIDQLLAAGAAGVCVDRGGDVRVGGLTVGGGDDWVIAVDDPFEPGHDLALLRLAGGAVTTSSRVKRRWSTGAGAAHHLIDPTTGRPAESGLAAVTVVAGSAAWGEIHAKAALIAGPRRGRALIEDAGMCALLVADDGTVATAGPIDAFLVEAHPS